MTAPTEGPRPALVAEGLWADRGAVPVLRAVSLALKPGRVVAVLGPNGAGKSTLLMALVGLVRLRRGRVLLDGCRIDHLGPERCARLGVVLVPQGRHLFSELSVRENLDLIRFARGERPDRKALQGWLERFPQVGRQLDVPAGLLSGGQQQLVAVIRGLLCQPRVLLLDEPTAALAPPARLAVMDQLRQVADGGTAVAIVEQEVDAVLRVSNECVVMRAGATLPSVAAAAG